MADLFLGFDVGTTTIKGGAFDERGLPIAHAARSYPTSRPRRASSNRIRATGPRA